MGAMLRWCVGVLAVAVLAAACGGGGDGEASAPAPVSEDQPTDEVERASSPAEQAMAGPVTSADGRLTATPPEGAGPITVQPGEEVEPMASIGTFVAAYELGPDGSTFDEPVELRFAVDAATAATGVIVTAQSADGEIDALDVVLEPAGDGYEAVALLDHFTTVELRGDITGTAEIDAPAAADVGAAFEATVRFSAIEAAGEQFASVFFISTEDEAWVSSSPVVGGTGGAGVDELSLIGDYECGPTPGPGGVTFEATITVFFTARTDPNPFEPEGGEKSWQAATAISGLGAPVECAAAWEIGVLDFRCIDRQTGEDAEGCARPEGMSVSNPADPLLTVTAPDVGPDADLALSVFTGEILGECDVDGECNIFASPSFGSVETDWPTVGRRGGPGEFFFEGLPMSPGPDGPLFDVPPGVDTFNQIDLPGGRQTVVEIVVFVQEGDLQSTTLYDVGDVQAFLAGP